MEAEGLALRIGQPPIVARDLLRAHRETYRRFWNWSDAALDQAMLTGSLNAAFGWRVQTFQSRSPLTPTELSMRAQVLSANRPVQAAITLEKSDAHQYGERTVLFS